MTPNPLKETPMPNTMVEQTVESTTTSAALAEIFDATDINFRHAVFCNATEMGAHNCAVDTPYLPGIVRVEGATADAPPIISACAWANEEDRALSVSVHFLAEGGEGAEVEGWFDPATARAFAAQLIAAADLVESAVTR
jgi:hypothetical protein